MGLADSNSRLTSLLALMGQIAILLSLPAQLVGAAEVYWPGLLLLAASPQLALLAQLGLSRVREFDALSGLVLSLQCRENRPVFSACSPHAVSGLGF